MNLRKYIFIFGLASSQLVFAQNQLGITLNAGVSTISDNSSTPTSLGFSPAIGVYSISRLSKRFILNTEFLMTQTVGKTETSVTFSEETRYFLAVDRNLYKYQNEIHSTNFSLPILLGFQMNKWRIFIGPQVLWIHRLKNIETSYYKNRPPEKSTYTFKGQLNNRNNSAYDSFQLGWRLQSTLKVSEKVSAAINLSNGSLGYFNFSQLMLGFQYQLINFSREKKQP